MFDLPPPPASSQPAPSNTQATDAAEAALAAELAAELASTVASGSVAADAPDSRTDLRVEVAWPARMQLPDGHIIELGVRNISEGGVGLRSDEHIPADTVVSFEMDVPPLDEGGRIAPVKGAIRTTYTVADGAEFMCGGTWQAPPSGLELVTLWIKRLWR